MGRCNLRQLCLDASLTNEMASGTKESLMTLHERFWSVPAVLISAVHNHEKVHGVVLGRWSSAMDSARWTLGSRYKRLVTVDPPIHHISPPTNVFAQDHLL